MSPTMPVKNIMTKVLKENQMTPYAFWKAMGIGQNTAYRLCNDPDSIPSKKIMDRIYEVFDWLPGDYLTSDREYDNWLATLPELEREKVIQLAYSYQKRDRESKAKQKKSSNVIAWPRISA